MINAEDMTSLTWLKMHWETHYTISLHDGVWEALPVGGDTVILTADSAVRLRDAMKDDFAVRAARERHGLLDSPEHDAADTRALLHHGTCREGRRRREPAYRRGAVGLARSDR